MPTYLDYEQVWADIALECRTKHGFANEPQEALVINLCREQCKEFEWHDCIWLARKMQREQWMEECAERNDGHKWDGCGKKLDGCKGCTVGGV